MIAVGTVGNLRVGLSSSRVSAVPAAPVNSIAPVISGAVYLGQTLSSTTGVWMGNPVPTFAYQWRRGGVSIGGATSSTYLATLADEGQSITCNVTATNASGSATATSNTLRHFIPLDLGAALSAWYDAADPSTITLNGSTVSEWRDRSASVRHVSQATAANQPAFNSSAFNSRAALVFNGTSHILTRNDSFLYAQGGACFLAAFSATSGAVDRYLIAEGSSSSANPIYGLVDFGSTTDAIGAFLRNDAGTGIFPAGNTALVNGVFTGATAIAGMLDTGSQLSGLFNGTASTPLAYTRTNPVTMNRFAIGGLQRAAAGSWAPITTAGVVLATALSLADRQKVEGFLAHRNGITVRLPNDHPFKTLAPTP